MNFSVGIAAYNEAANIGRLLDRLLVYQMDVSGLAEVVVVASGCTDGTESIVRSYAAKDCRVRLITESHRKGKATAVNLFIENSANDLLVLMSADILPDEGALELLVGPFADALVGVTAGRIIPQNERTSFMGFYVNLFWSLHHRIALKSFKAGEAVAFRKVFDAIPADTATDETWIVQLVQERGYFPKYIPQAVFRNRGPDNIRDFLKVRRRHLVGYHHLLKLRPDWKLPDTMDNFKVLKLLKNEVSFSPRNVIYLIGSLFLELWARAMARYDFYLAKRNPFVWDMAASTKDPKGKK
ncbi:MAG: glycosyltransferase [Candidatus Edwardsbacteria bacterium]|nr:glycosyltransferase [Candidatus Edwardsbacteria bacterium]MBU1576706.1 glycosyltransferase [Candidatus Edwardsbacteria bacterium]MBU2463470.1 glycosyltransferase [Candidatus Edwardsbacteria bacterium]MBU2594002.1 glycosyltransferase [Candidatus Edwardsbacteria bacterium]